MKSLVVSRGNPYLTMTGLSILGSVLLFFFLVLVFFARIHADLWKPAPLPPAFGYSTLSILLSSAALYFAGVSFKAERFRLSFHWITLSLSLGFSFGLLQFSGWIRMLNAGARLDQTSNALVFLLSGLHFLHVLLGLFGLAWIWFDSYQSRQYVDGFLHSLNPVKMTRWRVVSVFWHFLDALWLVLFALLWWHQP